MKWIVMTIMLVSIVNAGFFQEENTEAKAKVLENARLCKLFKHKAEVYKKTMRDDILAKTTLASYEHRASLFCGRAGADNKASDKNQTASK